MQQPLYKKMAKLGIKGTILLAQEGINGTMAGEYYAVNSILLYLQKDRRFNNLEYKFSYSQIPPFKRLKVKLKKEIVTLGVAGIDVKHCAGVAVLPQNWNDLISKPDVVIVDTRNDYEYEIGTFKGAINPNTQTFKGFVPYSKNTLVQYRNQKIAMFCTGGIRCEKSTAHLKNKGFKAVYYLKGGILKYLEAVPEKQSLWQGECFVFDDRVAVKHGLKIGQYDQCHACRYPITKKDKAHKHYEKGVSCPRCFGAKSKAQLSRYREREYQTRLAYVRGEVHIGDEAKQLLRHKKQQKLQNQQ